MTTKVQRKASECIKKALLNLLLAQRAVDELNRTGQANLKPAWQEAITDALYAMRPVREDLSPSIDRNWKIPTPPSDHGTDTTTAARER